MTLRIFRSLDELDAADFPRGTAVAIGKFDGVHLGHRSVFARLRTAASERGLESLVFTFSHNPLSLLRPELCPVPVMSPTQRIEEIGRAGIDAVAMVDFTPQLAQTSAEEYAGRVLAGTLAAKHVIVGADFHFGNRGAGDTVQLEAFGRRFGFTVEIIDEVGTPAGERVSSTRIREAIVAGDVAGAGAMLGREVAVRGEVVHGDARGRELGFPTANLGGEIEGLVPADGVYAGYVTIDGDTYVAAISVGNNPTFTPEGQSRVEAFLLDFSGDLYGKSMEVRFAHRIRGMVAFEGIDALIAVMNEDVRLTRELMGAPLSGRS